MALCLEALHQIHFLMGAEHELELCLAKDLVQELHGRQSQVGPPVDEVRPQNSAEKSLVQQ